MSNKEKKNRIHTSDAADEPIDEKYLSEEMRERGKGKDKQQGSEKIASQANLREEKQKADAQDRKKSYDDVHQEEEKQDKTNKNQK